MIKVEHLTKYYGDFLAVDDLSFEIDEGHVYGFLGPNGAGKTTTMNIMTGCLSASSGHVSIGGFDIFEDADKAKRLIGYLPEQPPLYISNTDYTDYVTYNVTDEELATYGLDAPEVTVTVEYTTLDEESDSPSTFTLRVSRDPVELAAQAASEAVEEASSSSADTGTEEEITAYARIGDSPIVYQISGSSYESLMKYTYNDLRHTDALTADFADVTGFDVSLEGQVYNITSQGTGDDRTFLYGEEEIDITDLQSALTAVNADSFTDESPAQKEEIGITVHLDNEAHPTVQLEFYRYDGEHCLAVVDGTPFALVARSEVVDLIEAVNTIVL